MFNETMPPPDQRVQNPGGEGPQGVVVEQPSQTPPYYNPRMIDLAQLSPSDLLEVVRVMLTPVMNPRQKEKFWALSQPILALGFYKEDDLAILNLQFRNQEVTRNMGRFRCERKWADALEEVEARTIARVQISRGRDHSERLAFQTNVQTSKVEGMGAGTPPIRDRLSTFLHGGA